MRLLSALFGALTIPLVYAVGRTIRDHSLGLVGRAALRDLTVPALVLTRGGARLPLSRSVRHWRCWGSHYLLRYPEQLLRSGLGRLSNAWRARGLGSHQATVLLRSQGGRLGPFRLCVGGQRSPSLPTTRPSSPDAGKRTLMLGWWLVHGRTVRFLRNWLVAQGIVLLLWGTWLPAYMCSRPSHGAAYWIRRPTVRRVLFDSYNVWGWVGLGNPTPCGSPSDRVSGMPWFVELRERPTLDRFRSHLGPRRSGH